MSIAQALAASGFVSLGRFNCTRTDGVAAQSIEIIANAGPAMFAQFAQASEYRDGAPHPLDRWCRRVINQAAQEPGLIACFPFDGPPFYPFQRWAKRVDCRLHQSPLGLLIHETYGLWVGLRAAILYPDAIESTAQKGQHPCESCSAKPCLQACPVDAFDGNRYHVDACATHLIGPDKRDCMGSGCAARRACPIGQDWVYSSAQARFHMAAFTRSRA